MDYRMFPRIGITRFVLLLISAAMMFCRCGFCQDDGPQPIEDVYKILLDRHIPFDLEKTRRATVEGLIKAVDPESMLLTAEQYHDLLMEKSVEKVEEWPEDICYVKMRGIYRDAADEIIERIKKYKDAGKAGVVLDLRDASGQSLASLDRLAALYVAGDPLLYQLKDGRGDILETHRLKLDSPVLGGNMPLVLLVNEKTREASEMLAALFKNRPGVFIVGSPTSGDAGYRENVKLSQDEILRIATKRVVMNDAQYEGVGVQPDIVVAEDTGKEKRKLPAKGISMKPESEKARFDRELMEKVYPDPVLLRTTDILLAMKATVSYGNKTTPDSPSPTGRR